MQLAEHEVLTATVDLEAQTLTAHASAGDRVFGFDYDPVLKERLLQGLDEIALTLQHENDITVFEKTYRS
jgi:3-isopropylmalate/(R)-2-methylmalate dehydratase small subunit